MKKTNVILIVLAALTFCACNQKTPMKSTKTIAVTIEPMRYIAEQLAGEHFSVMTMVPKGSSPETYEPTPRQMLSLSGCTAYFSLGTLPFERNWLPRMAENAPNMQISNVAEGINPITQQNEADPHVWMSARNVAVIAKNITAELQRLDVEHQNEYRENLTIFLQKVQRTDDSIRAKTAHSIDKIFAIYHPALTYFARDYGWQQLAIEEEGKEPAPARLQQLIETCKTKGVHTLFVQQEFTTHNAEIIAKETGATLVRINPLAYQWDEEMLRIANTLSHE